MKTTFPLLLFYLLQQCVYSIWYAYVWYQAFTVDLGALLLLYAGVLSLPVMIPIGINSLTDKHVSQ